MLPKLLLSVLCLIIFGCATRPFKTSQTNAPSYSMTPAKRLALLVGINNYVAVNSLAGCLNDVADMEDLLRKRYGFQDDEIVVLRDNQATHARIVEAFQKHLIARATTDSAVLFYFSGHGSQMIDVSGDEDDGLDETIVPYDSRTAGVYDISDDELNGLFTVLGTKTKNATFILDSCHSGTGTRGLEMGVARHIPADKRRPPTPPAYALSIKARGTNRVYEGPEGLVTISGCQAAELSYEYEVGGQRRGAMTYALGRAIRSVPDRNLSYAELMTLVRATVTVVFPQQHPEIEGDPQRAVLGLDAVGQGSEIAVTARSGAITVNAGALHGLTKGSHLLVLKADGSGPPVAEVELIQVSALQSTARLATGTLNEVTLPARLKLFRPPDDRLPVFIAPVSGGKGRAIAKALERKLTAAGFTLTTGRENAEMAVTIDDDGKQARMHVGGLEPRIVDLHGNDAEDELNGEVEHWTRWLMVVRRDNARSPLKPKLEVSDGLSAKSKFKSGELATFTVTNAGGSPFYFSLIVAGDNGKITQIYRRAGEPLGSNLNAAGQHVLWSGSARVSVPAGRDKTTDVIKVFASTKPMDLSSLELSARDARWRDVGRVGDDPDSWASATIIIETTR